MKAMTARAACQVSAIPAVASSASRQVSGAKSTNRLSCKNSKTRDSYAASPMRAKGQGAASSASPGRGRVVTRKRLSTSNEVWDSAISK